MLALATNLESYGNLQSTLRHDKNNKSNTLFEITCYKLNATFPPI